MIVVVFASRVGGLASSIVSSVIAALCLAYLAPPAHSFRVDDPLDVVAILAFLCTSLIIARLVSRLQSMTVEALSSVNRGLIDAEERERARIARDLHDDVGQRMALLASKVEQLRTDVPNPPAVILTVTDELLNQIEELCTDIQALSHSLHSTRVEYLGLANTMRGFCREFERQQKVEIDFTGGDLPKSLPQDVSVSLFRVLQEALRNSVKHSGVRQFKVELFEASDAIHLRVSDSGLGFDPDAAMKGGGLGLISMRERIKLVKGEFSIDSQLRYGTRIHAMVPLLSGSSSARAVGKRILVSI